MPDGNLSSSITEAREEMEPHIIEVGTGENVVLPIVTNYVGDDSLAKGAIQVSSSSSNATENQNKLSVDMTKKAISSPSSQRIKEVGILPHTGEKSTSAIATAGAVILTTALGMLGFAKRKENNF